MCFSIIFYFYSTKVSEFFLMCKLECIFFLCIKINAMNSPQYMNTSVSWILSDLNSGIPGKMNSVIKLNVNSPRSEFWWIWMQVKKGKWILVKRKWVGDPETVLNQNQKTNYMYGVPGSLHSVKPKQFYIVGTKISILYLICKYF